MDTPCRVFLVGSSIFMLALEAALKTVPQLVCARAEPACLETLVAAAGRTSVAVLHEPGHVSRRLLRGLAQSGVSIVSLDACTGIGTHHDGRQRLIADVQDLLQLARGDRA